MKKILIVEDDVFLCDGLYEILQKEGYSVTVASNVAQANAHLEKSVFDLLIFDVMLPDGNGFDLCVSVRKKDNKVPILFLTACDDEVQIVRGLDAGADDYVTKPFKLLELLSRVRALLRRTEGAVYKSSGITLDTDNMTVKKDGEIVFLTPTEYMILSALIRNRGIIVPRSVLLQNIWDNDGTFIDDNTLSVHVSRLRDKIGGGFIKTVRGIGYRWEETK